MISKDKEQKRVILTSSIHTPSSANMSNINQIKDKSKSTVLGPTSRPPFIDEKPQAYCKNASNCPPNHPKFSLYKKTRQENIATTTIGNVKVQSVPTSPSSTSMDYLLRLKQLTLSQREEFPEDEFDYKIQEDENDDDSENEEMEEPEKFVDRMIQWVVAFLSTCRSGSGSNSTNSISPSNSRPKAPRASIPSLKNKNFRSFREDYEVVQSAISTKSSKYFTHIPSLTKPEIDRYNYKPLVLSNGLKVLLINDPNTTVCAAALTLGVGSMSDPTGLPGLAHFCEHMLFLGTKKYPVDNGFDKFVGSIGGNSNGFTARDYTTFHFEIPSSNFEVTLDHFAQFFICPLYEEESAEREVNIVDSENRQNISNDYLRVLRVDAFTSNHRHPYSKFTTGNKDSLWYRPYRNFLQVGDILRSFHDDYYSSNLMSLAVLGNQNLEELQTLVESLFQRIKNKHVHKFRWATSPYKEHEIKTQIDIVPVHNIKQIWLRFYVPDPTPFYKTGVTKIVSHLIGHEGYGGLLSYLRKKFWITKFNSGFTVPARGFSFFTIKLDLTEAGWIAKNEIVTNIFQYIKLLQFQGCPKWLWKEISKIHQLNFQYDECLKPQEHVKELSLRMHKYPMSDLLWADNLITEFNPVYFRAILNYLVPSKCRYITVSKTNKSVARYSEEWYGVEFFVKRISKSKLKEPSSSDSVLPKLLLTSSLSQVWFKGPEILGLNVPKAVLKLEIYIPLTLESSKYYVLNGIFVDSLNDMLAKKMYNAKIAGLYCKLKSTIYGIEIHINGYNDKLPHLLEKIMYTLAHYKCTPESFTALLWKYKENWKKIRAGEQTSYVNYYLTYLISSIYWNFGDIYKVCQRIKINDLMHYYKKVFTGIKLNWLVLGNLNEVEVTKIVQKIENILEARKSKPINDQSKYKRLSGINLTPGPEFIFRDYNGKNSKSSTVCCFFQIGKINPRDSVLLDILIQYTKEPSVSFLKTKQQIGYFIDVKAFRVHDIQGYCIIAQSDTQDAMTMECSIDNFLEKYTTYVQNLGKSKFTINKNALSAITLDEQSAFYWNEIVQNTFNFDRMNQQLNELEKLSTENLAEFFNEHIGPNARKSRISIQIIGNEEHKTNRYQKRCIQRETQIVSSADQWKTIWKL